MYTKIISIGFGICHHETSIEMDSRNSYIVMHGPRNSNILIMGSNTDEILFTTSGLAPLR